MDIEEVARAIESMGGVLTLRPRPGDDSPEISWGDLFFYYAPDWTLPPAQPFATIVTKDYPDEPSSQLSAEGDFRVNIGVGSHEFKALVGPDALGTQDNSAKAIDPVLRDTFFAHPVYGQVGWVAVVNPAERSSDRLIQLLASAHAGARRRAERRGE